MRLAVIAVVAGSGVLVLSVVGWIRLPDIVAFGLRFKVTHEFSTRTLLRLGPRAAGEIFRHHEELGANTLTWMMGECPRTADNDAFLKAFLHSFRDPNVRGPDGMTMLHVARPFGSTKLVQGLIERGADVNARDDNGNTPLHCAGSSETLLLLLQHGADVNARSKWNETPLYWAVVNRDKEQVKLLLQYGADPSIKITDGPDTGKTVFDIITGPDNSEIADILHQYGSRSGQRLHGEDSAEPNPAKELPP